MTVTVLTFALQTQFPALETTTELSRGCNTLTVFLSAGE